MNNYGKIRQNMSQYFEPFRNMYPSPVNACMINTLICHTFEQLLNLI